MPHLRKLRFEDEQGNAGFRAQLAEQRWDDHRFYHHSLVNQSLHFVSACTFMVAYAMLFVDAALASLLAWGVAMTSRQAGHFFFEPKGYDHENAVSHEYKEEVKVGYNLARKWVLMISWAAIPVVLWFQPTLFGLLEAPAGFVGYLRHVGFGWLFLGVGAILLRVAQLWMQRDLETGIVWATKIATDPFSDFRLYKSAPKRLLKGERMDDHVAA
ncbi:hypothetical protein SAMN06297144_2400 [Sphingomonas guangdongensis]|uniref:DUF962 domain-containing protein n=1 Tax=Sphingomonas guangdongensis TaxID=1141890 RepID=A0A285QZG5_9SPHN|nr:hypothetical protein [Sphingomonas guangdongensis]SOB87273.1 hypothetical protein SAMN06297144_2400 [Sphingomonas guangdongensis]